jgi:superfamily II DNA or RNA helicase
MSRKFSPREAKALAADAKALFQGLDAAASSLDNYDLSVSNAIRESRERKVKRILKGITLETIEDETGAYDIAKLKSAGFRTALDVYDAQHGGPSQVNGHPSTARIVEECANRARAGVRLSLDPGKKTPETDAVILAVYARLKAGPLVNECRGLARDARSYSPDVDKELRAATGTIRWLFASRQNKETAEEACERLSCLLDGGFGKKAHSVLNDLSALYGVSPETTWAEFATDANAYLSVVGNAEPGCIGSDDWSFSSTDADNAIAKATTLSRELDAARSYLPKIDLRIKESVNTYLVKELLDTLAGASVDEMARSKQGIRTKPLKDAGYKTLADVYTASLYDLESVHGIGESMASSAKRFTQQYAAEAKKGLRLRLSTDRKTPEATAVVGLVYARLRAEPLVDKCEHLAPNVLSEMDAASHGLLLARNPEKWLFASKTEMASASKTYDRLRGFLDNAGGKEARDALRRLEALNKTSTDIYTTWTDAACTDFSAAPVTQRLLLLLRHITAWADFSATPVIYYNVLERIVPDVLGADGTSFGLPEDLAREVNEECIFPDGLLCTLRRYQEWGVKYILHQERVLLGDEMGLGKTIEAIATMVSLRNTGAKHFIVICPASVLENWCREIRKHSRLRVTEVYGPNCAGAFADWRRTGSVAVTTYETTARLRIDDGFRYDMAIVDEAHYIKNPDAARTKNVIRLCQGTDRLLFMTGTALENRVDEMLLLIGDLRPDVARKARPLSFMSGAPRFRDTVAPVYYRRKREDVLTELPDLIENEEWCTLGPVEEEAYERAVLSKNFMAARRVSWNVESLVDSSKARRLMEIVSDAEEDGRRVLVFTFFLDTARCIVDALGAKCVGTINGSVAPAKRQQTIEEFDAAPRGSVLVAQIQSGGTGLNIQSASVVVICEPQYKPSIENQAISRAYRMGQTRSVQVFRLLCKDTVDERITELLKEKQSIFDAFADKSSAAATAAREAIAVDDKGVGKIIEEEIERIKAKSPHLADQVERERETGGRKRSAAHLRAVADNIPRSRKSTAAHIKRQTASELEMERSSAAPAESAAEEHVMFCSNCGHALSSDANFCSFCGKPLHT